MQKILLLGGSTQQISAIKYANKQGGITQYYTISFSMIIAKKY